MGAPRSLLAGLVVAATLVASTTALAVPTRPGYPPLTPCKKFVHAEVLQKGHLTVATNSPALAPWFSDDDPANGKGYESALAYDVGKELGFKSSAIVWTDVPFEDAETPGTKAFDFDINEAVYERSLTSAVSFSIGYFNVNQSIVALKTSKLVRSHTAKELTRAILGVVEGTPSASFVHASIRPVHAAIAYQSLAGAVVALQDHAIDAIVIDTPSGHYLVSQQLTDAVQVGQFHTTGQYYALVFPHKSVLVACVDSALRALKHNRTITSLSRAYLQEYNQLRFLKA